MIKIFNIFFSFVRNINLEFWKMNSLGGCFEDITDESGVKSALEKSLTKRFKRLTNYIKILS